MTEPQGIPLAPAPTITTEDGRTIVAFHARCLGCGYDLHGLYVDARCPECAQPVSRSLMGNLYRFCAPDFVATVRRGALVALVSWLSIFPAIVAAVVIGSSVSRMNSGASELLFGSAATIMYLALLGGWWFMSTPDPGQSAANDLRSRRFLRLTILVAAIATLLDPLTYVLRSAGAGFAGADLLQLLLGFVFLLGQLAKLLQWFAAMSFARTMSTRLESPDLARFARFLWWAPIITLGVVLLSGLLIMLVFALGGSAGEATALAAIGTTCFFLVTIPVMSIILYVVYAVFLGRVHHQLGTALALARRVSQMSLAR